jgi:serine/threonine protein kinase
MPLSTPAKLAPPPMLRRSSCDLFECIEQHSRLSEDQARFVFAQIVDVVYHLATMGICHREWDRLLELA